MPKWFGVSTESLNTKLRSADTWNI